MKRRTLKLRNKIIYSGRRLIHSPVSSFHSNFNHSYWLKLGKSTMINFRGGHMREYNLWEMPSPVRAIHIIAHTIRFTWTLLASRPHWPIKLLHWMSTLNMITSNNLFYLLPTLTNSWTHSQIQVRSLLYHVPPTAKGGKMKIGFASNYIHPRFYSPTIQSYKIRSSCLRHWIW